MSPIKFILWFQLANIVAYIVAGVIALSISKDIYEDKNRLCTFMRDMKNPSENKRISILFIPAQVLRALLMSLVLLPLVDYLITFSFLKQIIFFSALMFVFTHIAAVSPFLDNIEGLVYFKKDYIKKEAFLKFQLEMVIYSLIFGIILSVGI